MPKNWRRPSDETLALYAETAKKCKSLREFALVLDLRLSNASRINRVYKLGLGRPQQNKIYINLNVLPLEMKTWLLAQVPKGGTVNDLILAIIRDAYLDEH